MVRDQKDMLRKLAQDREVRMGAADGKTLPAVPYCIYTTLVICRRPFDCWSCEHRGKRG